MEDILNELKEYLNDATTEQLEDDWNELSEFEGCGPLAEEWLRGLLNRAMLNENTTIDEK